MKDAQLLEDVCNDQHKCDGYCVLKEIILRDIGLNRRLFFQLSMVNKYKFLKSKQAKKDLGWEGSFQLWVHDGLADRFAVCYTENISLAECWNQLNVE